MQRRLIRWRRLFISPISGTKPPRRKSRSRLIDHSRLETLEVRQLLSATLSGTSDTQQFDNLSVDQLAMVEHVQSLGPVEFRTLTAEQAPLLSHPQIHSLSGRVVFQRIPLAARQSLTADQVSWLRVRRTGLRGLTDDQIDHLSVEQVQSLKNRDVRSLSPAQIPNLSAAQTSRLTAYQQLRKLSDEATAALTGDQIRTFDIRRSRLDLLTGDQIQELSIAQLDDVKRSSDVALLSEQQLEIRELMKKENAAAMPQGSGSAVVAYQEMRIGNMSVGEIRTLAYRDFSRLSGEQSPYLTLEQVASIPNGWWFGRISSEARATLTNIQVRSLTVSETGLKGLTTDQIGDLSPAQILSLNYREFERLAPTQTPLLTADQVSSIPNSWWFGRLSDDARSVLTAAQVQALRVDNLGLSGLTPTQVAVLALDQILSLSFREFHFLTEAQTPLLSAEQVATIPNSWWFGRMSVEARAAITPDQVKSLAVAEIGVGSLTLSQVRALSKQQVQSLGYREFQYLSPEQIIDLTGDQVRALQIEILHLGGLTESQRAELSVEQIQRLTYRDFRYVNAVQTPELTTEQVGSIPNDRWFARISAEARAALLPEQVQALNVSVLGVGGLTAEQASQLSPEQVQSLGYRNFEKLGPDQIVHLSAEQLETIPNHWWFGRIPDDSRAALTDSQVQTLNVAVLGLGGLTTDQIAVLTTSQIQSVGYREFERLNADQSALLTGEQLQLIPNHWWFERIPDDVRAALTGDQVRMLSVETVGLSGLTAAQIAELSAAQVRTLSYRAFEFLTAAQTPELTAEQLQSIPNEWRFYRVSDSA
jgi:phage FluMu protein gp41